MSIILFLGVALGPLSSPNAADLNAAMASMFLVDGLAAARVETIDPPRIPGATAQQSIAAGGDPATRIEYCYIPAGTGEHHGNVTITISGAVKDPTYTIVERNEPEPTIELVKAVGRSVARDLSRGVVERLPSIGYFCAWTTLAVVSTSATIMGKLYFYTNGFTKENQHLSDVYFDSVAAETLRLTAATLATVIGGEMVLYKAKDAYQIVIDELRQRRTGRHVRECGSGIAFLSGAWSPQADAEKLAEITTALTPPPPTPSDYPNCSVSRTKFTDSSGTLHPAWHAGAF